MADERVFLIDLGRVAYEAYRTAAGGRSMVSGKPLPVWGDQTPQIRECWRMAADGVRMWLELHPKSEETR